MGQKRDSNLEKTTKNRYSKLKWICYKSLLANYLRFVDFIYERKTENPMREIPRKVLVRHRAFFIPKSINI